MEGEPVLATTASINALKNTPGLLVIVLLNCVMVVGAAYFLTKQEEYQHTERLELLNLLTRCNFTAKGTP
jgi:hypothetical protein